MNPQLVIFFTLFCTDAFGRGYAFSGGSFGVLFAIALVLLALYLWRRNPLISICILSILVAVLVKSFTPLLMIAACFLYVVLNEKIRRTKFQNQDLLDEKQDFQEINSVQKENSRELEKIKTRNLINDSANKNYRYSDFNWEAFPEGIHCQEIEVHYFFSQLKLIDSEVVFQYQGAICCVPIKNIKNWDKWFPSNQSTKPILKTQESLLNYQWQRKSETSFVDLQNQLRILEANAVILKLGKEGVLLQNENGNQFFVDASVIKDFWNH